MILNYFVILKKNQKYSLKEIILMIYTLWHCSVSDKFGNK